MPSRTVGRSVGRAEWFRRVDRRFFGASSACPTTQTYVAHLRQKHPGCAVPSEQEFFDQYVTARYSGGPTRCC